MEKGYKTSEFWLTAVTTVASIAGTAADFLPAKYGLIASAIATGLYAIGRSGVKMSENKNVTGNVSGT